MKRINKLKDEIEQVRSELNEAIGSGDASLSYERSLKLDTLIEEYLQIREEE